MRGYVTKRTIQTRISAVIKKMHFFVFPVQVQSWYVVKDADLQWGCPVRLRPPVSWTIYFNHRPGRRRFIQAFTRFKQLCNILLKHIESYQVLVTSYQALLKDFLSSSSSQPQQINGLEPVQFIWVPPVREGIDRQTNIATSRLNRPKGWSSKK